VDEVTANVWYADQARAEGMFKVTATSDKGTLQLVPGGFTFYGRKGSRVAGRILGMRMSKQTMPWPMYAVGTVVSAAWLWLLVGDWLPVVACTTAAVAFALIIGRITSWVCLDYLDQSGRNCRAYFADGSSRGWGGIFGGTHRLSRSIATFCNTQAPKA
jgi:hypothetical protein